MGITVCRRIQLENAPVAAEVYFARLPGAFRISIPIPTPPTTAFEQSNRIIMGLDVSSIVPRDRLMPDNLIPSMRCQEDFQAAAEEVKVLPKTP